MNSKKNIIVVSARRSGTHLITDLIVNNFGYESIDQNYMDFTEFTWPELNGLEKYMKAGNKVTWTHAHDFRDYHKYNHTTEQKNTLDKLFAESKIILIYRDVRDIITSCYHRPRTQSKYKSFSDFYNNFDFDGYELIDQKYDNFSDLLIEYYKNWFSVYISKEVIGLDMEVISFEEIIEDYTSSVNKIAKFLEQEPKGIDVRLSNLEDKDRNILYTDNDFRKGTVGDWVNTLDKELGEEIGNKYQMDLQAGLDCFINDIKIHKYHRPEREDFISKYKNSQTTENGLILYKNKGAKNIDVKGLLENRYTSCTHRGTDLRYKHKVFYYKNYILKFIYPCKARLDKKTFYSTVPAASKDLFLMIMETDEFLYKNGIVPKLHYVGIYNGVLFVIQERCPSDNVLFTKFNFYPKWNDWSWVVKLNLYSDMTKLFHKALDNNILLTDLFNVYNCAYDKDGVLKYFDLDGIRSFNSREDMIASEDYKNAIGILGEIDKHYLEKEETFNTKLV